MPEPGSGVCGGPAAGGPQSSPAPSGHAAADDFGIRLLDGDARPSGLHRVERVMGTVVSIDVRDTDVPEAALDDAIAHLHAVDRRFSTYKPDSEVSRIALGELASEAASGDVRWVMALCDDLARLTGGYFDARRHRPDGMWDPTGVVKGWAVEEAAFLLIEAGARNFYVNAGGDVVARGEPAPGLPWRVGVAHPRQRDRLATVLNVRDAAVATSGTYERGLHIVDPHSGDPATALVSLTVVGPSLTYADAYATAAFAMGLEGPAWVAERAGYAAFAITADDRTLATAAMSSYRG